MTHYKLNNCEGFILEAVKNISKKEFIELCNNLQNEFNNYYNTDEYSFRPECITEGGIVFNNFNNFDNNINTYKSMRIYFVEKSNTSSRKKNLYGWINNNIADEWISDESILINKDEYIRTYTKCINAPKWDKYELTIFKKCFENIGLFIVKIQKY
jgi:hypothetical protein